MKRMIWTLSLLVFISAVAGCSTVTPKPAAANVQLSPAPSSRETSVNTAAQTTTDAQTAEPSATPSQIQPAQQAKETQSEPTITYSFTGESKHPEKNLLDAISQAKKELDIATPSLTNKNIVNTILKVKENGVKVRLITDRQNTGSKVGTAELKKLKAAGIPIKVSKHQGRMGLNLTIADKTTVTSAPVDIVQAAVANKDEVLVTIRDQNMAQGWGSEFEKIWGDQTNYQDYK